MTALSIDYSIVAIFIQKRIGAFLTHFKHFNNSFLTFVVSVAHTKNALAYHVPLSGLKVG